MRLHFLLLAVPVVLAAQPPAVRPPAVPLITHDPYFSVWSMADKLTDEPTKHWTGSEQQMAGLVRIDGATYRFMGAQPRGLPALEQKEILVTPTRTIYRFESASVRLRLTFFTPALPSDLDVLSRPLTYVNLEVRSADGRPHDVSLYFDCTAQLAVNTPDQAVTWSRVRLGEMEALRVGSTSQQMLVKAGDNLRGDWGFVYLAAPPNQGAVELLAGNRNTRTRFAGTGKLPVSDDLESPRAAGTDLPLLAAAFSLGPVGDTPVTRQLMVAYDDLFSIEYLNRKMRPYWRRNGMNAETLLRTAASEYEGLVTRAKQFDEELQADLERAGGPDYAKLAVLAFRQTLAAHKLVADLDGSPFYFSKENFSNGCIDTVDVTYPSAPFFLLFNPKLLKGQLTPLLDYAMLPRWKFRFAPHDLGTYPLANGQVYGGREENEENQMPVEESGNLLILMAALAKVDGNAEYARHYWPLMTKWAEYLQEKGMDPENQLSTDDFAGHLAHNTNLSIKAIEALGGYAVMADMLGKKDDAQKYRKAAAEMAARWPRMAEDGDHYRLAFDKPGSWSQKYNLVWDRLLGLNLFPPEVARKEIAFYKAKQNKYGLPLDNREAYTKLDWIVWTATLTEKPEDFAGFITPAWRFLNESSSRVPMTDWYGTVTGKQQGFQARSVVGGVYIKMLADPQMWEKWASRTK